MLVKRAIESIDDPVDAHFVFRDVKYVLSLHEYAEYLTLDAPEALRAFLRSVFEKRDPMPATAVNARLAEHYRRLVYVERNYVFFGARSGARNPDVFRRLEFPTTFDLAAEFDDRGIVYLRHGEPDERVATMGMQEYGESWRYARRGLDFHFRTRTSMSPRLQPLPDDSLLKEIQHWDGAYRGLSKERELTEEQAIRKNVDRVSQGVATDHFTWDTEFSPIRMPVVSALFRGDDGSAELYAFYALPAAEISQGKIVDVEIGASLHDSTWNPVHEERYVKRIVVTHDAETAAIDLVRVEVVPGRYRLSLHAHEPTHRRIAVVQTDIAADPFDAATLAMSDLVPAFDVRPTTASSEFVRHGLELRANPMLSFSTRRPLYVYLAASGSFC